MKPEDYYFLHQFFGAYLNEDFDISGNSIEEIVKCYKSKEPVATRHLIINEIDKFKKDSLNQLDEIFYETYGWYFDPKLWGHTTASFFDELKRLLQEE